MLSATDDLVTSLRTAPIDVVDALTTARFARRFSGDPVREAIAALNHLSGLLAEAERMVEDSPKQEGAPLSPSRLLVVRIAEALKAADLPVDTRPTGPLCRAFEIIDGAVTAALKAGGYGRTFARKTHVSRLIGHHLEEIANDGVNVAE